MVSVPQGMLLGCSGFSGVCGGCSLITVENWLVSLDELIEGCCRSNNDRREGEGRGGEGDKQLYLHCMSTLAR